MEEPLPRYQFRLFHLESFQKSSWGSNDLLRIDGLAPGHEVGVDHPLAVEEGYHHLLCPAGMDFCLHKALCAVFQLLIGLAS